MNTEKLVLINSKRPWLDIKDDAMRAYVDQYFSLVAGVNFSIGFFLELFTVFIILFKSPKEIGKYKYVLLFIIVSIDWFFKVV